MPDGERQSRGHDEDDDHLKIHISRVPTKFDESIVLRILNEHLFNKVGDSSSEDAIQVDLIYPRDDSQDKDGGNKHDEGGQDDSQLVGEGDSNTHHAKQPDEKEHRGFGFITFQSSDIYEKAISLTTIKGGRKATSKKQYTMHIRPYTTSPEETNICYLWSKQRCPYGEECKFSHTGPGGCLPVTNGDKDNGTKKKGKCFAFKKGKCDKGDDCPYSHDFEPTIATKESSSKDTPKSEKDCINWKSKGKCRKGDACPYRHDPELLKKSEAKKKRKRQLDGDSSETGKKQKQPLCVRVFGMAYDTTEDDIRHFFDHCGKINEVTFPTFEDSGRSKGYCGIVFASPKAVEKAIELNGEELLGRWLSVQAGKMYLRDWEANHLKQHDQTASNEYDE